MIAMDDQLERLKDIFAKRLQIDRESVRLDSRLVDDLDVDSLFIVELAIDVEKIFGVKIPDNELDDIHTVGDIMNYIKD